MITIKFREKTDWRTMVRIEARLKEQAREAVEEACQALVRDIRSNWSLSSPSRRGEAPAVVTGNLDSSVVVDENGRDLLGRFAGKDSVVMFVRVDTSEGANPGDRGNYAPALEDEDYLDRPFINPAIERVGGEYPAIFKRIVKL